MVLEKIFKPKWLIHRTKYSFLLGMIFVIISTITSYLLFRYPGTEHLIGIGTILFTVVIALPIVNKLLMIEEKEVLKNKTFVEEHRAIIDFYIYFFLGMFVMFFMITLINPQMVFTENNLYGGVFEQEPTGRLPPPPSIQGDFGKIITNNLYVMMIAFVLSLFYGSGALFIITLNASIFGSAIARVIIMRMPETGMISYALCNIGIMFFHMIPEVTSYFLAAIAGGIMSKALTKEKIWGKKFNTILADAIKMMIISIIVLVVATWIELNITKNLIMENACVMHNNIIILIAGMILAVIVLLERKR